MNHNVIKNKALKENMCKRAGDSGLYFGHIKSAFNRNGADGVATVFKQRGANGKARVTNHKRIIAAVSNFLANLQ